MEKFFKLEPREIQGSSTETELKSGEGNLPLLSLEMERRKHKPRMWTATKSQEDKGSLFIPSTV